MPTLQEQLSQKVLDPQREANNAINYKPVRGSKVPPEVMKAKLDQFTALIEAGTPYKKALRAVSISPATLRRFAKEEGRPYPDGRKARYSKNVSTTRMKKNKHLRIYAADDTTRKQILERAKQLILNGDAMNWSHAASKLGMSQATMSRWKREYMDGKRPYTKRTQAVKPATNGAQPLFTVDQFVKAAGFPDTETEKLRWTVKLLIAEKEANA
jgi:transposase